MSSLLEILQRHFGHIDSSESADKFEKGLTTEGKTLEVAEKTSTIPPEASCVATAELVFPFQSSPLVVAGIPETYLPLCGPKTLFSILLPSPIMYP